MFSNKTCVLGLKDREARAQVFQPFIGRRLSYTVFWPNGRVSARRESCSSRSMQNLNPDPQTFQIIGAAMEVHRQLHRGLLESIYCEALAIELTLRDIPFEAQCPLQMEYKGHRLTGIYRMDFVCFGSVVVEVKGASALTPADEAQRWPREPQAVLATRSATAARAHIAARTPAAVPPGSP